MLGYYTSAHNKHHQALDSIPIPICSILFPFLQTCIWYAFACSTSEDHRSRISKLNSLWYKENFVSEVEYGDLRHMQKMPSPPPLRDPMLASPLMQAPWRSLQSQQNSNNNSVDAPSSSVGLLANKLRYAAKSGGVAPRDPIEPMPTDLNQVLGESEEGKVEPARVAVRLDDFVCRVGRMTEAHQPLSDADELRLRMDEKRRERELSALSTRKRSRSRSWSPDDKDRDKNDRKGRRERGGGRADRARDASNNPFA